MRIVIAGGHGQIARQLGRLVTQDGHEVVGLIRKAEHVPDLEADGVGWKQLDLEDTSVEQLTEVVRGADAVVFAAGGGPDGNAARKETVDKGAAVMLADAAVAAGVRRYVMISSMGQDRIEEDSDEVFQVYLRAKRDADDHVRSQDALDWTVVQPGKLTDDVPTGTVAVGDVDYGSVTRGDVAHVLAEVLESDHTIGRTFAVIGGDQPVAEAVRKL
ncbi:SDR family oxidoreductase [Nocardioides aurantiacus]|uniref:Putative NADH-flavin reductase n=1 Tax=Nocardioides aurantiacus TaxID=86796 RepID=A0A3N2CVV0_9ACTN|nr:SDR family oxidoreductase [Nocardioides aurantiacus]ROR91609.1 putative NADH-flavin reductase [Nocardioides aurantiacus]